MSRIEQFFRKIPGTRSELKDIDPYIDNIGDFRSLRNIDVLIRSIINLLLTAKGTYLFDPEYGCNLYKYVWEPADQITQEDIYMELEQSLRRYEDRGDISYDVLFLANRKGFIVNLSIQYRGTKKKVSITIDESILKTLTK